MKAIFRRPLIHHLVAWSYMLAPAGNVLLASAFLGVPVAAVIGRLERGYGPLAAFLLVTAPLAGAGLYVAHRAAWYAFVGHCSLVLADLVGKATLRPGLFAGGVPLANTVLIVAGDLALLAVVLYAFREDFRAPYFQAPRRSFREHRRLPVKHRVTIDGVGASIEDLSIAGCFVRAPRGATGSQAHFEPGQPVTITFSSTTLSAETRGVVTRVSGDGYGVLFAGLSRQQRRQLRKLLRNRDAQRYPTELTATWRSGDLTLQARVADLSATGCFLSTSDLKVAPGGSGSLALAVGSSERAVRGRVVWVNAGGHEKPRGFGLRFARHQRGLLKLLIRRGGEASLGERDTSPPGLPQRQ